jgi:WD40 repeat protein/tetratricopeptide (TPR) repeat protein
MRMSTERLKTNPFPGLRPFTQEEDYLFFGREEQTLELLTRLGSHRFVAVVGTSGSGKSSLVRCGLLSELLGGKMLEAGASWEIAVTHPGGNPLVLLTEALLDADLYDREQEYIDENLLATLSRSHFGLVEAVKQAGRGEDTNFLLVVDQFEEIFRFHEAGQKQQEHASEFISLLLQAVAQKEVPIYVVLTMRSDFIGECGQFEGLAEMVNRGEFLIPRLNREQYKRVIEGPIKVAGGQIAPRLLQRLLNDLGQEADQLPCLQHALMRTWTVWAEKGDQGALDLDHYQRVGKMTQALSLHADEIYDALPTDRQRALCRGLFQGLTVQESENRGIRRPQRLGRLCQILNVAPDELTPIIDAYRRPGVTFLMPGAEVELTDRTIIDISHESLMRVWTRLRHWVEEEAQAAGIYLRLSESAALYERKKAGLYRDPELGIALAWQESQMPNAAWAERYRPGFEAAMAFLAASQQASVAEEEAREAARQRELEQARQLAEAQRLRLEQQRRSAQKLRRMIAGLAIVAGIAIVACVAALLARHEASRLADVAEQEAAKARQNEEKARQSQQETANALTVVEHQKTAVEESLSKAEAAEEAGRKLLYTTDMQLAPFVWRDDRTTADQLRVLLAKHVPDSKAATRKPDLRGFEWHYYRHLLDRSASIFSGHAVSVADSAFAADGQLVTLDQNGQLRRWDLESQAEDQTRRRELLGGVNPQTCVVSPDGRLAALAAGAKVHVFDTTTGKETFQVPSGNFGSRRLIFSRDKDLLVIVDNKIRWVNAVDGAVIATFNRYINRVAGLALSADGLTLAVVGQGNLGKEHSIFRLDATTQKVTSSPNRTGLGGTISAAALSPDGQWIACGHLIDTAVSVSETATGRVVARHNSAHASPVWSLAFSDDGAKLATADAEGTVKIWENPAKMTPKTTALLTLKGHQGGIKNAQFSSDGKRLVTGSVDKTARVWDLDNASAAVRSLERPGFRCDVARFSPDGLLIAVADGPTVRLWDAATGRLVRQLSAGDKGFIHSLAFSPTDSRLLAVGHGGPEDVSHVGLWDIDAGTVLARLAGATDLPDFRVTENSVVIGALAFSPDGKHLVAGFGNKHVYTNDFSNNPLKVWEVATRRLIGRLQGHTGFCISLDFSKDGTRLASGSRDGTAIIWSTATWKAMRTLRNVDTDAPLGQGLDHVEEVAFAPDGKTLAMASHEGSVRLWDVASGKLVERLKGHSNAVRSVAYSPDGRTLASGSADQSVRLWNVQTRRELMQLDPGNAELGSLRTLAFAPDGMQLLAGGKRTDFWSALPIVWNDADRAAEKLRLLLRSNADFPSRIRMMSENLRLHEALAKLDSKEAPVQAALAATRANWHAAQQRWPEAVKEFDRLMAIQPSEPAAWLRTPGLLRVATALLHQDRPVVAAMLLQGGAKRRTEDGLPLILTVTRYGFLHAVEDGAIRIVRVEAGSPAARSTLRPGDIIVKVNDVEMTQETIPNFAKMVKGGIGTTIRLTVRHSGSSLTEDIDLTNGSYRLDEATGEIWFPLLATLEKRLADNPRDAGLLELSAELTGQTIDSAKQLADYTAAIDVLAEQPTDADLARLRRLYRSRAEVHVRLKKWQEAIDDFTHVIGPETTDAMLLAQRARVHETLQNWYAASADWARAATGNPQGAKWLADFGRRLAAVGRTELAKDFLEKSQALYERALEAGNGSNAVAAELAQLLLDKEEKEDPARWTILPPSDMKSAGATLTKLEDDSILATGQNPLRDTYTVTFRRLPARIHALCLEVLPHESLPLKGPGRHTSGNFHLTTVHAQLELPEGEPRLLKWAKAAADFNQQGFNVDNVIKTNAVQAWAIFPAVGKPHLAVLQLAEPAEVAEGAILRVTLEFKSYNQAALGRFRMLVCSDPAIIERAPQRFAAMRLTDPWGKLAATYRLLGDQQAEAALLKNRPEAAAGIGDLYAATQDWDRAIVAYRKAMTEQSDGYQFSKLAAVYQSAGRTREAIPVLAKASAAFPQDTLLSLKVASLQAWFGQEKELAATRARLLAFAAGNFDMGTVERAAKACILLPSVDQADRETALALARSAVKAAPNFGWNQLALGMAEYRCGNDRAAIEALLAAEKELPNSNNLTGIAAYYRAMSLFRQGKRDEARTLALAAAQKMNPPPMDEDNPLAGNVYQDELIVWLAYKEARALIQFDPVLSPKVEDGK